MSSTRLQTFKNILTERFTSVAVEIFGEVESIVEACYEENKRLRSILDMVLNPEIKLSKIDLTPHTGAATDVREQPPEPNALLDVEMSEPLIKVLKEETVECEVSWLSEQEQQEWNAYNLSAPECVKNDPEEEDVSMPCIADSYQVQVVECPPDSSATLSADEDYNQCDYISPSESAAENCPPLLSNAEHLSETQEHQKCHEASKKSRSKQSKQKTMLELPRMMPCKSFIAAPPDCQSFVAKLTEAFKDAPGNEKPLITITGLTADAELVDFAFGKVPKGCTLSYQCPLPSSQDYKPHKDAPSRPLLPLSSPPLKLRSSFPTLSIKEQQHLLALHITWAGACDLENSTRGCKESLEELRKSRLTSRFRDICKLKPGRSHAEHLVYKLKKGFLKCKTTQAEEEMKAEALREYCRHVCVNWSPCGFVVHPNAPWLGVTPDGLVYDPSEESRFGLVHVKCISLRSFTECSFLACQNGALQLKKSHRYYWHIQGEMMVTGTSWCDLFMFSKEDMLVQRIYRDKINMRILKKKLDEFFFYYYLPSLI
ncbi:uncharacterized protein LOC110956132 [Acanthochromis polyacanthus]|uniref:uncharacterized protein LOC110956132 n=1 Tax=Acanthochromis polyacanthus TaxID=80966 RepID=UPI000B8F8803|nr:uncharacterized protein LOC110956132 [Acanthochromis polyacanthus]